MKKYNKKSLLFINLAIFVLATAILAGLLYGGVIPILIATPAAYAVSALVIASIAAIACVVFTLVHLKTSKATPTPQESAPFVERTSDHSNETESSEGPPSYDFLNHRNASVTSNDTESTEAPPPYDFPNHQDPSAASHGSAASSESAVSVQTLTDTSEEEPLHIEMFRAILADDESKILNAITKGADINYRHQGEAVTITALRHTITTGLTPLAFALKYWSPEIASFLLKQEGIEVNDPSPEQSPYGTPLHLAAKYGYISIVAELLNKGASIIALDADGLYPFETIFKMVRRNLPYSEVNTETSRLEMLKHFDASALQTEALKNTVVKRFFSAAISNDMLRLFLKLSEKFEAIYSANINNFVTKAFSSDATEIIEHLDLNYHMQLPWEMDEDGESLLCAAAGSCFLGRLRTFIEYSNYVRRLDWLLHDGKYSPLATALQSQRYRNAMLLLDSGADPKKCHIEGQPLLHFAINHYYHSLLYNVFRRLIESGADVNERNSHGQTPLHLVLSKLSPYHGNVKLLSFFRALVVAGASFDTPDYEGRTLAFMLQDCNDITVLIVPTLVMIRPSILSEFQYDESQCEFPINRFINYAFANYSRDEIEQFFFHQIFHSDHPKHPILRKDEHGFLPSHMLKLRGLNDFADKIRRFEYKRRFKNKKLTVAVSRRKLHKNLKKLIYDNEAFSKFISDYPTVLFHDYAVANYLMELGVTKYIPIACDPALPTSHQINKKISIIARNPKALLSLLARLTWEDQNNSKYHCPSIQTFSNSFADKIKVRPFEDVDPTITWIRDKGRRWAGDEPSLELAVENILLDETILPRPTALALKCQWNSNELHRPIERLLDEKDADRIKVVDALNACYSWMEKAAERDISALEKCIRYNSLLIEKTSEILSTPKRHEKSLLGYIERTQKAAIKRVATLENKKCSLESAALQQPHGTLVAYQAQTAQGAIANTYEGFCNIAKQTSQKFKSLF